MLLTETMFLYCGELLTTLLFMLSFKYLSARSWAICSFDNFILFPTFRYFSRPLTDSFIITKNETHLLL
ncbi:hypothetical protein IGJ71_002576 [Enterococcus sp. DIV2324]